MVDIPIVNGIINLLITGGAPPCSNPKKWEKQFYEKTTSMGTEELLGVAQPGDNNWGMYS